MQPSFLCHNSELARASVAQICRYCCILLRRGIHIAAGDRGDGCFLHVLRAVLHGIGVHIGHNIGVYATMGL